MNTKLVITAIVAIVLLTASAGATDTYTLDPAHSEIGFAVKHMVISTVKGNFNDFTATLNYDPQDIMKSSVEVTIKATSIDTRNERRDNHLRSADFFEVEKYPDITFKSKKVVTGNTGSMVVGDLTIHGVTREVTLPFTITGTLKDTKGGDRIGMDAHLTINRKDYGLMWSKLTEAGGLVVSDEVQIELLMEWVKK